MFIINDYKGNENIKIDKQNCRKKYDLKWENFLKDRRDPLYIDEDDGEWSVFDVIYGYIHRRVVNALGRKSV